MRDPELERRIQNVLAQMSKLSEVRAASIGKGRGGESDRVGPQGTDQSLRPAKADRPPSKDRSLFDWYAFHFAKATADAGRRVLLWMAESDLKTRLYGATGGDVAPSGERRDERIVAWYEGSHPLEAAMLESHHGGYCSEQNVREVRRRARRNPETGAPLPGWPGWTDEERTKAVRNLKTLGKSIRESAMELGVTKHQIERYLNLQKGKRAA